VTSSFFTSDLHGSLHRYKALFSVVAEEAPEIVLLGGDLFPSPFAKWSSDEAGGSDFLAEFLIPELTQLRERMGPAFPRILLIPGNDDPKDAQDDLLSAEPGGLWTYLHGQRADLGRFQVFGYACVPPTPFLWKDWERYDVSRYVPPGCVSPEEGWRTGDGAELDVKYGTIKDDLDHLAAGVDLERSVFLFHTPPHETLLDRAALDGEMIDHVPLDLHVGSIAVRRFIEERQPLLTLHGHIHESARLTGSWRDRIGETHLFTGAHDGPELALVRFDLEHLDQATRELL